MLRFIRLNKKGMDTWSIIIAAVMVLILIAVVVYLVTKNTSFFNQNTQCESMKGKCVGATTLCDGESVGFKCQNKNEYCCVES
jgi:hypothetical protein